MNTIKQLILLFFILSIVELSGQGIIINHNSLDISQIPSSVIDDIQQNIKWQYAHTSHGGQLTCGLEQLEAANPDLDIEIGDMVMPQMPGSLCIYDGIVGFGAPGLCCQYVTSEGYWEGPGALVNVENTFNSTPEINVSGWMWCGELDTYNEERIQEYLTVVSLYEQMYPNITFIYFTGNAQVDGPDGYNRYLRSKQIREYCIANNKILYDFEDIDSWYNGEFSYYLYNGDTVPIQHSAYSGDDCGHVNLLSATQKGKAVWWTMAKIRGWQQVSSTSLNLKVFLQGEFQGSNMAATLNSKSFLPLNQPYNFSPIFYTGIESVTSIPNPYIVDWILLEYRDAATAAMATSSTSLGRKAAFLLNNGQVVDLDGISSLPFDYEVNQNLFVVLWHRNHIGIMSSVPLSKINNEYQYDFSTGVDKVYNGSNNYKELIPGIWGMIGGDWNTNGVINGYDKLKWKQVSGINGYSSSDYNLNGMIDNKDKNEIWIGNYGKITSIP